MKTLEQFIKSPEAIDFLTRNMIKLWCKEFQLYTELGPKQKGGYGELIASLLFKARGSKVEPRKNSDHDFIIDGYKTEVKFSAANRGEKDGKPFLKENVFALNHLALGKDWDRLVFIGVNPDDQEDVIFWISKEDAKECIDKNLYIKSQQSGKKSGNDDYMSTAAYLIGLYKSKYAKSLEQW